MMATPATPDLHGQLLHRGFKDLAGFPMVEESHIWAGDMSFNNTIYRERERKREIDIIDQISFHIYIYHT